MDAVINGHQMNKRYLIIILSALMILGCSHRAKYIEPTKEGMGWATIEGSTKFYVALLRTTPIVIDNGLIINTFVKHRITPGHHNILINYAISGAWFPYMQHYSVGIMAESNHQYITRGNFWGTEKVWVEDIDNPKIRWKGEEQ